MTAIGPASVLSLLLLLISPAVESGPGSSAQTGHDAQQYPPPEITVRRLSRRFIVLRFQGPQISNVIAIRSSQGIVVVDTESSPTLGALLKDRILEEFPGATIRAVINTHGHGDHTWGNQAFAEAEIIGHLRVLEDMREVQDDAPEDATRIGAYMERLETRRGEAAPESPEEAESARALSYYAAVKAGLEEGFRSSPPGLRFSQEISLELGDLSLHLYSFPNAHSRSDVLAHCPEEGLLATGDLFVSRMRPPYLRAGTVGELGGWVDVLSAVLDGRDSLRHVIPGHDEFLTEEDLRETRDYLLSERDRIEGKASALPRFQEVLDEGGPEEALAFLESVEQRDDLFLLEGDLVGLGYGFLYRERAPARAVRVFQTLTRLFPDSWNAWDCLGEASAEAGDMEQARTAYTRSLELNPENAHARSALSGLG